MQVTPYLNFDGRCDEAIAFYKQAVGAEVEMLSRFKDAPQGACPGGEATTHADKVMHAAVRIGESTIFVSDGRVSGKPRFEGISLTITAKTDEQAQRAFAALSTGGQISMPLGKTFFASTFGMCADKFGVAWMVIVMAKA